MPVKRKISIDWSKYILEFLSIFIGVSLAFALNKWNEDNKIIHSENKTLIEIKNGLKIDLIDLKLNKIGHQEGIKSINYFRTYFFDSMSEISSEKPDSYSLNKAYIQLFRDYIAIQNTSAYESLKSKGFEVISNDSLRLEIIDLYDFNYPIIQKLEEQYAEMQFHQSYFSTVNSILAKNYVFDEMGNLIQIKVDENITLSERNQILYILYKIEMNRMYLLKYYKEVETEISELIKFIENELEES